MNTQDKTDGTKKLQNRKRRQTLNPPEPIVTGATTPPVEGIASLLEAAPWAVKTAAPEYLTSFEAVPQRPHLDEDSTPPAPEFSPPQAVVEFYEPPLKDSVKCDGCASQQCTTLPLNKTPLTHEPEKLSSSNTFSEMEKSVYGHMQKARPNLPIEDMVPGVWRLAQNGFERLQTIGNQFRSSLLKKPKSKQAEVDDITKHFT